MNHQTIQAHIIVHGHVQGVGYRYVARMFAQELSLVGTARNKKDGTVEIFVQGPRAQIDHFIAKLKGPEAPGHVEDIQANFSQIETVFPGFSILPSAS